MRHRKQSQNPSTRVISGTNGRRKPSKRALLLAGGLILLFVSVGAFRYLSLHKKTTNKVEAQKVCDEDTISKASTLLEPDKTDQLTPIFESIQKLPNNDKDANCLYIQLVYYLNRFDAPNSRSILNKLLALDGVENLIDASLSSRSSPGHTKALLTSSVEYVETRKQEAKNNAKQWD